jgi:hypothetical protein
MSNYGILVTRMVGDQFLLAQAFESAQAAAAKVEDMRLQGWQAGVRQLAIPMAGVRSMLMAAARELEGVADQARDGAPKADELRSLVRQLRSYASSLECG